ncbi:hypothetical protein vseg_003241 [Gypsophila vaccaria]
MRKERGIGEFSMQLRNRGPSNCLRSRVDDPSPQVSRSVKKRSRISKSKTSKPKTSKLDRIENKCLRDKDNKQQSIEFATHALCFLLSHKNLDYELVKPGLFCGSGISMWFIFHFNFKAKLRGRPDDPVQTFFAQLRLPAVASWGPIVVDCCVNLGPTHLLPEKLYSAGCQYCDPHLVRHPIGGCDKLLLGCENDDDRWLFGDLYSNDSE